MAGTLTELSVAGTLAVKAIGKKLRGDIEPSPDLDEFKRNMELLIDGAAEGTIKNHSWLDLSANQPPWVSSEVELTAGEEVSCFALGDIFANKFLDIRLPLKLQIWCKIGEGDIFRGAANGHSFVAKDNGLLKFGNYFPNDWQTPKGDRQQDDKVYKSSAGNARVLIIQWAGSALEGLQSISSSVQNNDFISREIARIEQGDTTPDGWSYLWNIGPGEIYRDTQSDSGKPCIHCDTHGDTGILQKSVDLPLTTDSEVSWRWCIQQLPSAIREDAVPSHDYLSIAVEFDNGIDITYYWSSCLAPGTGYDCPLPNWKGKEFHVVVRSGAEGLGEWMNERRNLYEDYKNYIGEPPARIVKVWLIANSVFQRDKGVCDYSEIVLHQGADSCAVL